MKKVALFSVLFAFTGSVASAQGEMFKPAKELKKFAQLIGQWTGSGDVWMAPGTEPVKWTADQTTQWILDGHFVQEDITVKLSGEYPAPLQMRAIYGWDGETQKYASFGVGNTGESGAPDLLWLAGEVLVATSHMTDMEGNPTIERSTWRFTEGGYRYTIEKAVGTGAFFTHVDGTFKRANGAPARTTEASAAFMPPSQEIERLKPLLGTWSVKGEMVMMTGAEPMPISGVETMEPAFGGQVITSHIVGDPEAGGMKYEGYGYVTWNREKGCYEYFMIDNMGVIASSEGRWEGDTALVFTRAGMQYGKPVLERSVLDLTEGGMAIVAHRMSATAAPERSFKASYTKRK